MEAHTQLSDISSMCGKEDKPGIHREKVTTLLFCCSSSRGVEPVVEEVVNLEVFSVRVALLQNELWHEIFFSRHEFPTKNARKYSPNCLSLYFVGPKNPTKFPPNFPQHFPPPKMKKRITDVLLQECRENSVSFARAFEQKELHKLPCRFTYRFLYELQG